MTLIENKKGSISKKILVVCYIYASLLTSLIWIANTQNPQNFAIITMAVGLFFLWGIVTAGVMYKAKDEIKKFFRNKQLSPFIIVTFGGILLALLEEAFSTLMTNTAPLFGFSPYEVYITASPNYIEVVTRHSVIVFIPWFIAWGFILSKYSIHPNDVMVLFGITGILAESLTFGLQNLLQFGFWIIIYGLMIYLPAYCVYDPENQGNRVFFHTRYYPLLIILPFLALVIWAIFFLIILSL